MPNRPFDRGQVVREFKVTCGVCYEFHRHECESIDKFCREISAGEWRLSRELGWVHKSCCKMMPNQVKFNAR